MAISKSFLGQKNGKPLQEPLVPKEPPEYIKEAEEGKPVVITMHGHVQRSKRSSSLTTLCIFAVTLLVLTTGIIGGMYLYRQFTHYKLRHFHGWCSIPYRSKQELFSIGSEPDMPKANFFEEEFDIDIKYEQYETIEVPAFGNRRHGKFIHDFAINKTAILDSESQRCFLMMLNRKYVLQPRLLYEKVSKMRAGYYDVDIETIRHNMVVITSPLNDLKNLGFYITRACSSLPIFELKNFHSLAYRRSLNEDSKDVFVEFAGNKVHEFKISNLKDALSKENLTKHYS